MVCCQNDPTEPDSLLLWWLVLKEDFPLKQKCSLHTSDTCFRFHGLFYFTTARKKIVNCFSLTSAPLHTPLSSTILHATLSILSSHFLPPRTCRVKNINTGTSYTSYTVSIFTSTRKRSQLFFVHVSLFTFPPHLSLSSSLPFLSLPSLPLSSLPLPSLPSPLFPSLPLSAFDLTPHINLQDPHE